MRLLCCFFAMVIAGSVVSCVEPPEKKPVGPQSSSGNMPWNVPQSGQGMGQFGMMNNQMNQRR